jgi:glucose/arabinose dehydrogenase
MLRVSWCGLGSAAVACFSALACGSDEAAPSPPSEPNGPSEPGEPNGPSVPSPQGGAGPGMAPSGAYEPCSGTPVPALSLVPIATVEAPLYVTSAPANANELYIVLRNGSIVRLDEAEQVMEEFFSVTVSTEGEGGLLGFALHPEFDGESNSRFFASYTVAGSPLISLVEEYELSDGEPTLVRELIRLEQPQANHNGGNIVFGPDGYLYVGFGDGGGSNDGNDNAQDLSEPHGSILRLDVDDLETPPPGNLSGDGVDARILHYGLRNPWRFSFDRVSGDLYVGDVGQNAWEEVSVVPAGSGNANLGWPALEGFVDCTACPEYEISGDLLRPITAYQSQDNAADESQIEFSCFGGTDYNCSVTGGYVYRGQSIPGLYGRYLFAEYVQDRIMALTWTADDPEAFCDFVDLTADLAEGATIAGPSSFGEDADGELYVTMLGGDVVYRIEAE